MKLRRLAEDFQVEEQISLAAGNGPFALYKLTKQSLGMLEAIEAISRRWHLPCQHIAFAGLKDKHALTMQFVTIDRGPQRSIAESSFELKYVGQCERPVHASDIVANRFAIVARDLAAADLEQATTAIAAVDATACPIISTSSGLARSANRASLSPGPGAWATMSGPCGWPSPTTMPVIPTARTRRKADDPRALGQLAQMPGIAAGVGEPLRLAHLANQHGDFRLAIGLLRQDLRSLWLAAFQKTIFGTSAGRVH